MHQLRRLFHLSVVPLALLGLLAAPGARSTALAYSVIDQHPGFDTCAAPTEATMSAWWYNSSLVSIGVYIGGSNRSCPQPNLTSAWVRDEVSLGWGLIPLWVGPQLPYPECERDAGAYNSYIPLNNSTAEYSLGWSEAYSAYSAAISLGFDVANMPISYDLEGYDGLHGTGSMSACRSAAQNFMKGWTDELATSPAQLSGVYGSASSSHIDDFAYDGNPPDFIFFADWDGHMSTTYVGGNYIPSGHWVNYQRIKQYGGDHSASHGGVTIGLIDDDCDNGPIYYPNYRGYQSTSPCA